MVLRLISGRKKRRRAFPLLLVVAIAGGWWGYRQVQVWLTQPEAIFVLGGHESRERWAAQLGAKYPKLPIWVSSGSPEGYAKRIFEKAGVNSQRLHLDYNARDTVTNFTSSVQELKAHHIQSVYLVTSDNHMNRARLVGEIIFGSQGILIKPISVPSDGTPEPIEKVLRDGARAILWLTTGSTGEIFKSFSPSSLTDSGSQNPHKD
jgi:uncharacterized SAM-binding protein YcdF (DUF218 family)